MWSQRGTKFNGSHHGDNPLLRPTGIQIATRSYATLQATAPTNNVKTVHQASLLHTEGSLDRLGLLSPTHNQRSQQQSEQITLQPVLFNKSKFLKATHRTEIRKIDIPRSMGRGWRPLFFCFVFVYFFVSSEKMLLFPSIMYQPPIFSTCPPCTISRCEKVGVHYY